MGTSEPTPADPLVVRPAPCVGLVELTRSHTAVDPLLDVPDPLVFAIVTLKGMMSPLEETSNSENVSVEASAPVV